MTRQQLYVGSIIGALVILGLATGFYVFNNSNQQSDLEPYQPYRATLSGEYVCLPHVNLTGPQTDECAFGLLTQDGEYYAVDFSLISQTPPTLTPGDRISANGLVTPLELLSSNRWQQYPIEAIFSITDSVLVLEKVK